MLAGVKDRYGPYPRKKEKKQRRLKESERSGFEWLSWKEVKHGESCFRLPRSASEGANL